MSNTNAAQAAELTDVIVPESQADTVSVKRRSPIARSVFGDVVQFVDFILITVTSIIVAYIYHVEVLITELDIQRYAAAGILGATGLTTLLRRDGFYEFDQLLSGGRSIPGVLARVSLVILGLIAFGFALKISEEYSRFWLFAWAIAASVLLIGARVLMSSILSRLVREGGVFARRVAVIGATQTAVQFAELLKASGQAVTVVGVYRVGSQPTAYEKAFDLTGDLAQLAQLARSGGIDDIVIAKSASTSEEMHALVSRLSILPVSISICANNHWLEHTGGEVSRIGGAPVLSLYKRPLEGWGGVLKSIEDRVGGVLLLLAASPIMLAIAIAIKLQGKGPILFSQNRHGFNHAVFNIYKFRTMTVAENDEKLKQATLNDPRITPLGRFLRRYSLDELPQLLNVVAGDMSLVGPRPHALAHNHQYAQTVENYSGRHKVKPGITGWAQVNGCRGETSENEMMAERVKFDLEYIDNWSLWFDIKILVLTIKAVLFPKNAY